MGVKDELGRRHCLAVLVQTKLHDHLSRMVNVHTSFHTLLHQGPTNQLNAHNRYPIKLQVLNILVYHKMF
ncbi:unnamed protein product [Schistosoma mattheei]|uniref:Uncharacterized protein n=1 Tax=Schistosoma mattheei TaxID=31246 RepID=A0A3P8EFH0_9TREM|nr:unnamed protein product [Schistosoma mattheei]